MNRIIKGKKYDTDTAKKVGEYNNGEQYGDFSYWEENLYQKKTGEFFLFGWGGALSPYAEQTGGGNRSGGQKIEPLTYEEARSWSEKYLNGDNYESIFGSVEEDDSKIVKTFTLETASYERLRREAVRREITVAKLLDTLSKEFDGVEDSGAEEK